MKKYITLIGLIIFSANALCAPPIKQGQRFVVARKLLVNYHWKPLRKHSHENYEYGGLERILYERGFKELEFCTVDTSQCVFYYVKKKACIRLDTMGEKVDEMIVVQWSNECPDSK